MSALVWRLLVAASLYSLLFYGLNQAGLLSVDEPRYAAIGAEMARSGDWITPRLWGTPWFEKPALLYWLVGLGTLVRLPPELAARLPVALLGLAFLWLYQRLLARELGSQPAWYAAAMLATSAGWLGFSHVAVTDLPVSVFYAAAVLYLMPWALRGEARGLTCGGICLGLAVLAKGLVPLVLAAPLLWFGRARLTPLWRTALAAFLVSAPWYVLCALVNGAGFLQEFFWRHHIQRLASGELQHWQPFWFYVPVLLGWIFPWTPLVVLLDPRRLWKEPPLRLLSVCVLFGFGFFSLSVNKLPGYLLPLLPLLVALLAARLRECRQSQWLLAASAALLALLPIIGAILPAALASGLRRSTLPPMPLWHVPLVVVLAAAVWAAARKRTQAAVAILFVAAAAGTLWLKTRVLPVLDRQLTARPVWAQLSSRAGRICLEEVHRSLRYGLQFYAGGALPDCADTPMPVRLRQEGTQPPRIIE